jgi:hypothetical protein
MRPEAIRAILREYPELPKEIVMNDGSRYVVPSVEHWIVGPESLVILTARREFRHLAHRNIASIGHLRRLRRAR